MSPARASTGWAGLFGSAFKRSNNVMLLTDGERRILDINAATARALGYPPSQVRGRYTWEFVADGPLLSREEWKHSLARGEVTGEADVVRADGTTIRIQFGIHPEVVTGHQMVLFVALAQSRWGRHFRREGSDEASGPLSKREREVLNLVALGSTSPEIAEQLHISHNTVRKHVNSAMRKLGARSRAHLVAKALADGEIQTARDDSSEPSREADGVPTMEPA